MNLLLASKRYQAKQPPTDYSYITGSQSMLSSSIEHLNSHPNARLMDYDMYINKNRLGLWGERKAIYCGYYGDRCQVCRHGHIVTLHHLEYRNVGHEDVMGDLVPICNGCHKRLEGMLRTDPRYKTSSEETARREHLRLVLIQYSRKSNDTTTISQLSQSPDT